MVQYPDLIVKLEGDCEDADFSVPSLESAGDIYLSLNDPPP